MIIIIIVNIIITIVVVIIVIMTIIFVIISIIIVVIIIVVTIIVVITIIIVIIIVVIIIIIIIIMMVLVMTTMIMTTKMMMTTTMVFSFSSVLVVAYIFFFFFLLTENLQVRLGDRTGHSRTCCHTDVLPGIFHFQVAYRQRFFRHDCPARGQLSAFFPPSDHRLGVPRCAAVQLHCRTNFETSFGRRFLSKSWKANHHNKGPGCCCAEKI